MSIFYVFFTQQIIKSIISTYKFKRHFFRHERRTAPKFGTHDVRIETRLVLAQKNVTHPTPGEFRGLSIDVCVWVGVSCVCDDVCLWVGVSCASLTYFGDLLRRTAPKFGTHVRIDTLTLK